MTPLPAAGPRMLPAVTDETRDFWTGGGEGRLLIPRCTLCRRWVLPASSTCPECGGATGSEEVSGGATVMTWTVNAHPFHPDVPPPNLIAIVVLDEQDDLRLATNLIGCDEADLRSGLPVQVVFEDRGQAFYPLFTPVPPG
jgi:uncharacterized OB-fold protein